VSTYIPVLSLCVCPSHKAYPTSSMMRLSWLYSELPGKSGRPRNSSAQMHPSDHMSIDAVYLCASQTKASRCVSLFVCACVCVVAPGCLCGWVGVKERGSVRHADEYFGGAIEARLDVGIHGAVLLARRAKVDDLDHRRAHTAQEHRRASAQHKVARRQSDKDARGGL
jgi:hypothetical protein